MNTPLSQIDSLGRYTLIRELGRGGMSVVYLAKDKELGREVAIKCVDTSDPSAAKLAQRLRSEAKLLAQLNHPNIVQLYDVVEQDNILGLVIEFVGGDTLTQRLKQAPSKEVKLKWLAEVADGLASAHQKGIAHCDLKADNVLITHDNIAKVADFGIAKVKLDDYLEDDGLTRIDSVSGSYFSLSPEQASGQAVDTRTDLFSLAILIQQTLTREHPFGDTSNKVALLQRVINDEPNLSESAINILGVRLGELIKTMLSKSPEDRLYTASEAGDLLKSAQSESSAHYSDDQTMEIPVRKTSKSKPEGKSTSKPWLARLGLLATGFLVGLGIIKISQQWAEAPTDIQYIALDNIEIETSSDFNQQLLPLVESTLQESAENAILSLSNTNLISNREFQSVQGNYVIKAKATGVKSIINLTANCDKDRCEIKVRKHEGELMAISDQKSWPVAVQNLTDIRNSLGDELQNLYSDFKAQKASATVSEESYREYVSVLLDSKNGKQGRPEHLSRLQTLASSEPYFKPPYSLASRITKDLFSQTARQKDLLKFQDIVSLVPKSLMLEPEILNARISLLLLMDDYDGAKKLYKTADNHIDNKAALISLETDLAYYGNQSEKLLELDRKNVLLRPSAKTYYNLAYSEYSQGNFAAASEALTQALSLHPEYSFAINMKATLAMKAGDLQSAIAYYKKSISLNPRDITKSNLGLAYALSGKYNDAIAVYEEAISSSPNSPQITLNLADAYKLKGNEELSQKLYEKVIVETAALKKPADYILRSQALAQNGDSISAVRVLNLAKDTYPDSGYFGYASATVHSIAGNNSAALVAVENAINEGTGRAWFRFPWFKSLCKFPLFVNLTSPETNGLCERKS